MELVLKIYYLLQVAIVMLMIGCLILLVCLKLKVLVSQVFIPKQTNNSKKQYQKNMTRLINKTQQLSPAQLSK
jgi:ABC-type protease/lipase transport system fused ATPase/permease subunit